MGKFDALILTNKKTLSLIKENYPEISEVITDTELTIEGLEKGNKFDKILETVKTKRESAWNDFQIEFAKNDTDFLKSTLLKGEIEAYDDIIAFMESVKA